MKNLLIILIFCCMFYSCKNKESLAKVLNKSEFTNSEKQDIIKMVKFFESKIIISEANFKEDYEAIIKSIYGEDGCEVILSKIDINEQRKLINSISNSTFDEIWYKSKSRAYMSYSGIKFEEPIPYESLSVNTQGKYVKLLQKLSKENPKIEYYTNNMLGLGDFPMLYNLCGLLIDEKGNSSIDFYDGSWRIIIAIHILSINENTNRYISLGE